MKTFIKLLAISLLIQFSCKSKDTIYENAICIENISTIDPVVGLRENQTVIVKDGKILKVANTSELSLSPSNRIIDGSGKYLIPGLWDAHVHFAYIEELAPSMFDLFLTHGITSVRDTGGKVDFVKAWKDKAIANPTDAPRVMMAGPLLDGEPNVYDGSDAGHPELSVGLDSVGDVEEQIALLLTKDVDLLKAYEMLTPEQFKKICELGKANNLKITGHVPLSMDVISASNAGLNSMEHMRNLEISCASNSEELFKQRQKLLKNMNNLTGANLRSSIHTAQRETAVNNYDDDKANKVLANLKKNNTWQIPTLALNTFSSGKHYAKSEFQESFTYLPDTIGKYWMESIERVKSMEPSEFRKQYDQWNYMMISKIHKAGIEIMAGTDTPIAFLTPGLSLHEELADLVKAGLSPIDALKTATVNPAQYFNLEDELGSIKENMWADLVILNANPLEDIHNTKNIDAIFKQGKHYSRENLDAVLKNLKENN